MSVATHVFLIRILLLAAAFLPSAAGTVAAANSSFVPWSSLDEPSWSARSGAASASLSDGRVLVMGGSGTTLLNDVWEGTPAEDGVNWTLRNESAPWEKRESFAAATLSNGSVLIMGGSDGHYSFFNDIWLSSSAPIGSQWNLVLEDAPWSRRAGFALTLLGDGSLLLMGGCCDYYNDVWRTAGTSMGVAWTRQTAAAGWSARVGLGAVSLSTTTLLVMGGLGSRSTYHNDVWLGTKRGANWTLLTSSAPWTPRSEFAFLKLPDGSVLIGFGRTGASSTASDVWRSPSATVGKTWTLENSLTSWTSRASAFFARLDDSAVLMGGGYHCQAGASCSELLRDAYYREQLCYLGTGPANGSLGTCQTYADSGAECLAECAVGYNASSDDLTTCWDGVVSQPTCLPAPCVNYSLPDYALYGTCATSMESGTVCQTQCEVGFTAWGTSRCSLGVFYGAECTPNPCFRGSASIEHGSFGSCPSILPSYDTCQPVCDTGFEVSGVASCWRGTLTLPICTPEPCNVTLPETAIELVNCPDVLESGQACSVECNEGLEPSESLSCLEGKLADVECVLLHCEFNITDETLPNGENGTCSGYLSHGDECYPVCDVGYTLDGPIACNNSEVEWTECLANPCDISDLPVPAGADVSACPVIMESGSVCLPYCPTGYTSEGNITCELGVATYLGGTTCKPASCEVPIPTHGSRGGCPATLQSNALCSISCDRGYTASNFVVCSLGNLTEATCEPNPCDLSASSYPSGSSNNNCPTSLESGSSCLLDCDDGVLRASCTAGNVTFSECGSKWCEVSPPEHGSMGTCNDYIYSGSFCLYSCDSGYQVSGPTYCVDQTATVATCENSVANISLTFTVQNLDYYTMQQNENLTEAVLDTIISVIRTEIPSSLRPSNIIVSLSAGSVNVEALLVPASPSAEVALAYYLTTATNIEALRVAFEEALTVVEGIATALTGGLSVGTIAVQEESVSTTTAAPGGTTVVVEETTGGLSAAVTIILAILGICLGMCCTWSVTRCCCKSERRKGGQGQAEGFPETLSLWMWPVGCLWGADGSNLPTRTPGSWV